MTPEDLRIAGAGVAKACIADRIESVTFMMPIEAKDALMSQAASEGIVLGSYQFNEFKSNNDEAFELKRASIFGGVDKSIQKELSLQAQCVLPAISKIGLAILLHQHI